jgi:LPXTG-site transpeptidase (sortase) family protein
MAIKAYKKRYSSSIPSRSSNKRSIQSHWQRIFPIVLMTVGSILLANVIWPILSFQFFTSPSLQAADSGEQTAQYQAAAAPTLAKKEYLIPTPKPTPVVIADELDYIDLSKWFPQGATLSVGPQESHTYSLSIPTMDIEDAQVTVGGTNLDKSLIQYPGTANPGEFGSPVIFGHSVLRQFYNPAKLNPRRYVSIFSKIMMLKNGDKIYIDDDRVRYTYRVVGKMEVKPDDLAILEQHHDIRELKLVTCTPEGTTLFRGIVTAQLEEVQ